MFARLLGSLKTISSRATGVAVASLAVLSTIGGAAFAASEAVDVADAQKPRLAFIVGNQRYNNLTVDDLNNPVNDGKLVARALRRLNFDVVEGYDLSLDQTRQLFAKNRQKIDNAEAVIFYYAGHGFQLDGKNYVVPVDAQLGSVADIAQQTVQLDAIVAELDNPDRPTLIFMDACRENPLPPSVDADKIDGLAQIEAGTNTFIAFSTELGKVSFGGSGKNSPFALAMATHLETPGQSVSDFMIAVRNETQALTLGRQTPWTQESLQAQFYFTDRQQLDPEALRIAAAQILNDPRQLEAFLKARDEENLSFLPAVFRARQRGVTVLGQPSAPNMEDLYAAPQSGATSADDDPVTNVEIASTAPTATTDAEGNDAVEALVFAKLSDGKAEIPSPEALEVKRKELASQLQTELRRLGCYRMSVDGIWGRGSRAALKRYFSAKKEPAGALSPTVELLNRTILESGRVCREPVIIKRKKKTNVARRTSPSSKVRNKASRNTVRSQAVKPYRRKAAQGQSRSAQKSRRVQRKQALPPDLRMGVGIGL